MCQCVIVYCGFLSLDIRDFISHIIALEFKFVLCTIPTAMLELFASYGSQVCINADIPEIVALGDRFIFTSLFASSHI